MSNAIESEFREFLTNANLSNYEINTYLTLLNSNISTAREISSKSGVPTGRIYEMLESLSEKGMIEVQETRPKVYRALSFNTAFNNLISHRTDESKRNLDHLINHAKDLENRFYNSGKFGTADTSKVFWSTAYGGFSIMSLYVKKFSELRQEVLLTGFLNENTIKILPFARDMYGGLMNALNRGVRVKYLWSLEYDDRPLSKKMKQSNVKLFERLLDRFQEVYNIAPIPKVLEMKHIHYKLPTYFDIFDSRRVIIKLQNPLKPFQIFACMNVLDPNLATELKNKYLEIWRFEANK